MMMKKHLEKIQEYSLNSPPESLKSYIKHLEMMRRDFVANASHELRTPLTVIKGYLEALLKQDSEQYTPLKKIFLQMHQHSTRMVNIIEDLLLLSRLEIDEFPAEEHDINIAEMLKMLCSEAKNFSGDRKHKITLKARHDILLSGADSELRSLFSNIIINAIKYTPEKGKIDIRWYRDRKNRGIFEVSDTGIGIAKKYIPRLTERFYRVDKGRSRESGGTGLGLAIVKHVLLRHQSDMLVESQIGKGSKFTCVFPASRTKLNKPANKIKK
jgi:two-component system phosphate regulon sensor histidine kinase PhoR